MAKGDGSDLSKQADPLREFFLIPILCRRQILLFSCRPCGFIVRKKHIISSNALNHSHHESSLNPFYSFAAFLSFVLEFMCEKHKNEKKYTINNVKCARIWMIFHSCQKTAYSRSSTLCVFSITYTECCLLQRSGWVSSTVKTRIHIHVNKKLCYLWCGALHNFISKQVDDEDEAKSHAGWSLVTWKMKRISVWWWKTLESVKNDLWLHSSRVRWDERSARLSFIHISCRLTIEWCKEIWNPLRRMHDSGRSDRWAESETCELPIDANTKKLVDFCACEICHMMKTVERLSSSP